jgi:hypothetical protein
MNATLETRITVTLPGLIAAADIRDRIEPTAAGCAYVACVKAHKQEEAAPAPLLEEARTRLIHALDAFHDVTGDFFYSPDSADCIRDAGRE